MDSGTWNYGTFLYIHVFWRYNVRERGQIDITEVLGVRIFGIMRKISGKGKIADEKFNNIKLTILWSSNITNSIKTYGEWIYQSLIKKLIPLGVIMDEINYSKYPWKFLSKSSRCKMYCKTRIFSTCVYSDSSDH